MLVTGNTAQNTHRTVPYWCLKMLWLMSSALVLIGTHQKPTRPPTGGRTRGRACPLTPDVPLCASSCLLSPSARPLASVSTPDWLRPGRKRSLGHSSVSGTSVRSAFPPPQSFIHTTNYFPDNSLSTFLDRKTSLRLLCGQFCCLGVCCRVTPFAYTGNTVQRASAVRGWLPTSSC